MSAIPCPVSTCGRPAASGLMCGACRAELTRALAGLDLVCVCAPDELCHADVLLKYANT